MKILIVDDDPFVGEMAAAILACDGHDCRIVEGGVEALETLASETFELVISDMNMPLMSGLALFAELRERACAIPFILLTGDDPEPLRAEAPGLADCLMKDATLEDSLPKAVARL
ncbi:MAG: response regulator [Sphingobacteriia bacterium]|nr:response regulator [Sphingobacteriia bacterium]NCC39808.1 response regulator [Gammaproteobacteria bacterium]